MFADTVSPGSCFVTSGCSDAGTGVIASGPGASAGKITCGGGSGGLAGGAALGDGATGRLPDGIITKSALRWWKNAIGTALHSMAAPITSPTSTARLRRRGRPEISGGVMNWPLRPCSVVGSAHGAGTSAVNRVGSHRIGPGGSPARAEPADPSSAR